MKNLQELTDEEIKRDYELIRLVKQGNRQAFTEIISLYQERVFKLAFAFFRDRDDAMEIVQETFIRIFEKIDKFDNVSSFRNWTYRIAYNLCIDFYRKFKSKKNDRRDVFQLDEVHHSAAADPEANIDRQNFRENLQRSLQSLSRRQKKIFMLKNFSALKYTEIADIMSISVGTVKSLHHRATQNLKKKLAYYEASA